MRWVILVTLLVLAACTAPDLDPELHGQVPAEEPNLPVNDSTLGVVAEPVAYHGDTEGYLARPDDGETYPGVVMIHEWWGLNDNIRAMARQLASEGYVVLAVDLYDGEVAESPDRARELVTGFDQEAGLENMRAAVRFLEAEGVPSVGSLGWCFGGGQSLQLGLAEDVDATVIYYGNLVTDERLSAIEQPVLGIFGAEDGSIPVSEVMEFDRRLDDLGVENAVYLYDGAGHAFANPSGDRYVPEAAEDAWQKTVAFLAEELQ